MNKLNSIKNIKLGRSSIKPDHLLGSGRHPGGRRLFLRPRPGHLLDDHTSTRSASFKLRHGFRQGLTGPTLNEEGTPVASVDGEQVATPPPLSITIPDSNLPPAWDGASRITVLLIGLDYRDWVAGEGAPRSDTMILLTIDPLTKTAGMLSIPARYVGEHSGLWV